VCRPFAHSFVDPRLGSSISDKQHAIDYEGERDVDTIIDFLQQHATIQFSKDEL